MAVHGDMRYPKGIICLIGLEEHQEERRKRRLHLKLIQSVVGQDDAQQQHGHTA